MGVLETISVNNACVCAVIMLHWAVSVMYGYVF